MRAIPLALVLGAACHAAPPPQAPVESPAVPVAPTPAAPPAPDRHPRMVVSQTTIELLDRIEFDGVSSVLSATGASQLDKLAETFIRDTDIQLVEVRAYGADAAPAWRKTLADERARELVRYLVSRGVPAARLRAIGVAVPPPGNADGRPAFNIIWRETTHALAPTP